MVTAVYSSNIADVSSFGWTRLDFFREGLMKFCFAEEEVQRTQVPLIEQRVSSADAATGWVPVSADLSFYAGRKFSLFYRPDSHKWQIIVGTHVVEGNPGFLVIGDPAIETDTHAARVYMQRLIDFERE